MNKIIPLDSHKRDYFVSFSLSLLSSCRREVGGFKTTIVPSYVVNLDDVGTGWYSSFGYFLFDCVSGCVVTRRHDWNFGKSRSEYYYVKVYNLRITSSVNLSP